MWLQIVHRGVAYGGVLFFVLLVGYGTNGDGYRVRERVEWIICY